MYLRVMLFFTRLFSQVPTVDLSLSYSKIRETVFNNSTCKKLKFFKIILTTYFAIGEVIDLLTDVGDIRFWFIVCSTTSDVVVGFRQTNDGAFQPDKHRVCQCGMVCLWVIA